ncbi:MAG: hypothetical protein KIS76_14665 [Pyrinomonadaceae bacterium]|nr:hypothetical protein [Pyrinomonadaceae bacterium]
MTNNEIEKRLEILEAEVALLKSKTEKTGNVGKPWYKQIPKFGGNPAYEEATRLGREYRESQKDFEDD